MDIRKIAAHYDNLAAKRGKYLAQNAYYHSTLKRQYQYFIPEGKKILEIGCGTGDLLADLKPSLGVGLDVSREMIRTAQAKYPQLQFIPGTLEDLRLDDKFDYIVIEGLLGELDDIQDFFYSLRNFCTKDTRIVIQYFSYMWQSILKIAEVLGDKMPQLEQNWLAKEDIANFLEIAGYQPIAFERTILFPFNIWGVSWFVNKIIAKLPIINAYTLNHFIIARPLFQEDKDSSVTILIPCRNEKGNIEPVIKRTPAFGKHQEFIFVEGHSKDGTYEEVERIRTIYPGKDIKLYKQPGKGKGDAVRFGLDKASGEALMILDADLTVQPEDLPKFYEIIKSGKGEFINGCRLVYPMEDEAMRFLNLLANRFFGMFFSWLLGQRFKDTLCGTKVISKRHYDQLVANRHYFGDFDPFGDFDLIFGAVKMHLKVAEVPIRYKSRRYGTTQIQRWRHGLLLLRMCWFAMWKVKFL